MVDVVCMPTTRDWILGGIVTLLLGATLLGVTLWFIFMPYLPGSRYMANSGVCIDVAGIGTGYFIIYAEVSELDPSDANRVAFNQTEAAENPHIRRALDKAVRHPNESTSIRVKDRHYCEVNSAVKSLNQDLARGHLVTYKNQVIEFSIAIEQ